GPIRLLKGLWEVFWRHRQHLIVEPAALDPDGGPVGVNIELLRGKKADDLFELPRIDAGAEIGASIHIANGAEFKFEIGGANPKLAAFYDEQHVAENRYRRPSRNDAGGEFQISMDLPPRNCHFRHGRGFSFFNG